MAYAVGSLVRARGREWVVLPESDDELLVLRPLGGTDRETAGIYLPLEGDHVSSATFALPDPTQPGAFISCRMLRDAVRLGFRNSSGPFRSFARLNVEPRPYQLVPLLMALRLDPVRLLIADDVGIGKTVEAGLIAREMLDRGEIHRLAVLCPPHLAEQWQAEFQEKFGIDAELVLASTAGRLERGMEAHESLFDRYPFVIVSMDFIKAARRRDEFLRTCPEFVIVDEAHTCAYGSERSGRHLRHQLLQGLAQDAGRHLLLVTATPHSGDEGAFRSLLALLRPDFAELPEDLTGAPHAQRRRDIAQHLVQRRRADVRAYLEAETPFPERQEREESYALTEEYHKLFDSVLAYAREKVQDPSGTRRQQRVRWWSALALLRSLASSPAAAAATLRSRSVTADAETAEEADELGERAVLDLDDTENAETLDVAPGGQEDDTGSATTQRGRLRRFAQRAEGLFGPKKDAKLARAVALVKDLLDEGFNPILFCRFIDTAEYVAAQLRPILGDDVRVAAVTGRLAPAEREQRVAALGGHAKRVLVATDCLSEGINLQDHFDAVVHYDLSWNPTRHEQRDGRVDRYGQPSPTVRTLMLFGVDNYIDGLVLDVLLRKHRTIRSSTGVSVPVPHSTSDVIKAVVEGLLLRAEADPRQLALFANQDLLRMGADWEVAAERERRSRSMFAQHAIDVSTVAEEWRAVREAIGAGVDVQRFAGDAIRASQGLVTPRNGHLVFTLPHNNATLREACLLQDGGDRFAARFELPVSDGVLYLHRTHAIIENLAAYVLDTTLDPLLSGPGRRCGATRTRAVSGRTTLLLARFRYHIITIREGEEWPLLAEDCRVLAFEGSPANATWLPSERAEALLEAEPDANIAPQQAAGFVRTVVDGYPDLVAHLAEVARDRAQEVLEAHRRVRTAARTRGVRYRVEAHAPDVLGVYVLLPVIG